jgi:hypothetical protein
MQAGFLLASRFFIPHRRLSRQGFKLLAESYRRNGRVRDALDELVYPLDRDVTLAKSTVQNWLIALIAWARVNHELLGILPDLESSCRGLARLSSEQIDLLLSRGRFHPVNEIIVPPD